MVFKNINNEHINIYEFEVNKQYNLIDLDMNLCEYTNSYPKSNSHNQKYTNYHWLYSNFYKNYNTNKINKLEYISKYQKRNIDLYAYFIKINNDYFINKIKEHSVTLTILNNILLTDDGYGNIVNKNIFNSINFDDFEVFLQELRKYTKVHYNFSDLKKFISNRTNGIEKTIVYDLGIKIEENYITDVSGFNNNSIFNNITINTDNYKTLLSLYENNIITLNDNNILKDTFKSDFTIILNFKEINNTNGTISLFKRYNGNNKFFELLFLSDLSTIRLLYQNNETINYIDLSISYNNTTNSTIVIERKNDTFYLHYLSLAQSLSNSMVLNIGDNMFYNDMIVELSTPSNGTDYFDCIIDEILLLSTTIDLTYYRKVKYIWEWLDDYYYGNVFYENGIISITKSDTAYNIISNTNNNLIFKNTKVISENEYICKIDTNDYNYTLNKSALQKNSQYFYQVNKANYTIPNYITSIGLYDNEDNLILVGKINNPIERIQNIPMNFIVKYDI